MRQYGHSYIILPSIVLLACGIVMILGADDAVVFSMGIVLSVLSATTGWLAAKNWRTMRQYDRDIRAVPVEPAEETGWLVIYGPKSGVEALAELLRTKGIVKMEADDDDGN
jgi:hypothetical protein